MNLEILIRKLCYYGQSHSRIYNLLGYNNEVIKKTNTIKSKIISNYVRNGTNTIIYDYLRFGIETDIPYDIKSELDELRNEILEFRKEVILNE